MIKPIEKWLDNHKNSTSFWLHMIGVPACFVVAPTFLILSSVKGQSLYMPALMMFIGGYAIQFIGHYIEGNRSGEEKLIRRLMKLDDDKRMRDSFFKRKKSDAKTPAGK